MILLQNLYQFIMPIIEMLDIYILYVRSVLEQSAVVWNTSITQEECIEIERIQKVSLRIIMKENYSIYENSLCLTVLPSLN